MISHKLLDLLEVSHFQRRVRQSWKAKGQSLPAPPLDLRQNNSNTQPCAGQVHVCICLLNSSVFIWLPLDRSWQFNFESLVMSYCTSRHVLAVLQDIKKTRIMWQASCNRASYKLHFYVAVFTESVWLHADYRPRLPAMAATACHRKLTCYRMSMCSSVLKSLFFLSVLHVGKAHKAWL